MSVERVLSSRYQCPECFTDLELVGLMDESRWEAMKVPERVNLCKMANIDSKHGSKSYSSLSKLSDEETLAICDYKCPSCGTEWKAGDLLNATFTPIQLEAYHATHRGEQ